LHELNLTQVLKASQLICICIGAGGIQFKKHLCKYLLFCYKITKYIYFIVYFIVYFIDV
jgi:hypothetical protein